MSRSCLLPSRSLDISFQFLTVFYPIRSCIQADSPGQRQFRQSILPSVTSLASLPLFLGKPSWFNFKLPLDPLPSVLALYNPRAPILPFFTAHINTTYIAGFGVIFEVGGFGR
ncbi:hypothetical protein DL96DRAFT_1564090 [Flagelloscypha sp. PMI_526]|nr:hypothetical protein DL96DRAFT_1564090 [Flagelloscypha sp. PMI_526]